MVKDFPGNMSLQGFATQHLLADLKVCYPCGSGFRNQDVLEAHEARTGAGFRTLRAPWTQAPRAT